MIKIQCEYAVGVPTGITETLVVFKPTKSTITRLKDWKTGRGEELDHIFIVDKSGEHKSRRFHKFVDLSFSEYHNTVILTTKLIR